MATPRPRPRPRPAQRTAPVTTTRSEPASRNEELEREDNMFIRNQTRTAEQWKKMQQAFKDKPATRNSSDEEGPSLSQKDKREKKRPNKLARGWQNDTNINRYLSQEISSGGESEDEIQIVGEPSKSKQSSTRRVSPGKRKRSKSGSLTPPPEASAYALAHARNVVRQAFNEKGRERSVSPIVLDEMSDDYITDPELRKIAEQAKKAAKVTSQTDGADEIVLVRVTWTPHPQKKEDKVQQWAFKMNRKDTFREMFEHIANKTSIRLGDLYVTYKGKRVYSSSSPAFLKMADEKDDLDACDLMTHEHMQSHKRTRSVSLVDSDVEDEIMGPAQSSIHSDDESEADVEKLTITLRSSKSTKDVTLKVKSTTTCAAIVAAFIKQAGIAANASKGRISIDGDKMEPDSTIGEADVEDGDMVEVVGL